MRSCNKRRSCSSGGSGQRIEKPCGGTADVSGMRMSTAIGSISNDDEVSIVSAIDLKPTQQPE